MLTEELEKLCHRSIDCLRERVSGAPIFQLSTIMFHEPLCLTYLSKVVRQRTILPLVVDGLSLARLYDEGVEWMAISRRDIVC